MKNILPGLFFSALLLPAASFEAATIKPTQVPGGNSGMTTSSGLLRAYNVTLRRCIQGAYNIPEGQILGGPKWLDELRFDIVAKADHPAGDDELSLMVQSLLAERFKLVLHHDTQTKSGYALTVMTGGIRAQASDPTAPANTNLSRGSLEAKGCDMTRLVMKLAGILSAPVVDMSSEKRGFDISLRWIPDDLQAKSGASSDTPSAPTLFTALQEQLGVKLEARKVPVDVLVIDHAELPSEN